MTTLDDVLPQIHPMCPGRVLGPSGVRGPCLVTLADGERLCMGHQYAEELGMDPDSDRLGFAALMLRRRWSQ